MKRGTEILVVLLLAFVVLPFTVLVSVGTVPIVLWAALAVACVCWLPAHRWSR